MRYRHKPTEVEAEQWLGPPHPMPVPLVRDCGDTMCIENGTSTHLHVHGDAVRVHPGDWILHDSAGQPYRCKPDVFAENYEPITEEEDVDESEPEEA